MAKKGDSETRRFWMQRDDVERNCVPKSEVIKMLKNIHDMIFFGDGSNIKTLKRIKEYLNELEGDNV